MMISKLKPCPFCGAPESELMLFCDPAEGRDNSGPSRRVQCAGCNVEAPFYASEAEAVSAWNQRDAKHEAPAEGAGGLGSPSQWCDFLPEPSGPAEGAGEIGAEYDAAAHCVTLAECPPGLFLWNGSLGFKSEYGAMEPDDATNGKHWKVGNRADAFCADSGEYFWGGATNHDDHAKLLVYPIAAETVAMVASHGAAALRARSSAPEAREGEA